MYLTEGLWNVNRKDQKNSTNKLMIQDGVADDLSKLGIYVYIYNAQLMETGGSMSH